VDENTLVFVVSYSGNTEETISQMREAQNKKCKIVTFASGGNIMQLSTQKNIPCLKFPKGYQPRAAIAFQFFGLAEIANRFGLAKGVWDEVDEALHITKNLRDEMDVGVDADENIGKKLAVSLYGYVPMIYGSRIFTAVSYRYCTQFNENSKIPAGNSFFPEAFHNSIMARESSIELLKRLCAVIIRDPKEEQVMSAKITKFCHLMRERFGNLVEIEALGEGRLARIASALYIGDYVSAYLGLLYGQDPSSTESIAILKS
jgi:glucose/mannose-6-phosphate isomerase